MTQEERESYLIGRLCQENPGSLPDRSWRKEAPRDFLRALMNVRPPAPIDREFLQIQDAYLQAETEAKGITDVAGLPPAGEGLFLWKGDITTLGCEAIVNAANAGLTGCYRPCHNCIDNCIHTYAGVQLRWECARIMEKQGCPEPTGRAKITGGYNLPCRHILHTVGPVSEGVVTEENRQQLASCYTACLDLAAEHRLQQLAFCSISTGVFGYPQKEAAQVAVETVCAWKEKTGYPMQVIFVVHSRANEAIYRQILTGKPA